MRTVDAYGVTAMLGTVDNYLEILDHPDVDRCQLSSLRVPLAMSFVTKLDGQIRRRWAARAGAGSVLREAGFGMTETHAVDTFTLGFQDGDEDINSRPVFCGLPVPGTSCASSLSRPETFFRSAKRASWPYEARPSWPPTGIGPPRLRQRSGMAGSSPETSRSSTSGDECTCWAGARN